MSSIRVRKMRVYITRFFCESTNSFKDNFINILAKAGKDGLR